MSKFFKFFSGLLITVALICPAQAAAPRLISFQGQLTDSIGTRLTGTYSMTFKIYNVSSGGSALWSEAQSSVSVTNGVFDVELGSVTALSLPFDTQYWQGVTVGSDAEMTPRRKLMSAPYALYADTAAFLAGSAFASGSFAVAETATLSGKVGIGMSNPGAKLHVTGNVIISDTLTVKDTVLVIKDNGNVGIGTTSPGRQLTVANSGADVFIQVNNSSAGGRKWNVRSSGTGSSKGEGSFSIEDENVGVTRLMIDTAGNMGIGTDTPVQKLQVTGTIRADTFEKNDGTAVGVSKAVISGNQRVSDNYGQSQFLLSYSITATETEAALVIPATGSITDFFVNVYQNSLNNVTNFNLRTQGVSRITVSYAAGEKGVKSSTGNNIAVAAGDTLTVQYVTTASTAGLIGFSGYSILIKFF